MVTISLDKQVHLYSVPTDAFYTNEEKEIHDQLSKIHIEKNVIKSKIVKCDNITELNDLKSEYRLLNKKIKTLKNVLYNIFKKHKGIRKLDPKSLNKKNIISLFESTLTRTLGIKEGELTEDLFVIQTYFFDVLKDIILHGFIHNGEKYICFTASAGQIRTKKTVFIKESVYKKHQQSLMCGLTTDKINELGGVNINKFLAYLALCNSATDQWVNFPIHKTIIVDDMETTIRSLVDFIDEKTYEITRKDMDILINHTDGCGMILPSLSKKSFMIRMPWIKGLLVPFHFDKFIKEKRKELKDESIGVIKDIYGKEYDILEDEIEIIFTKSQFKMWKYYSSWDEYKNYFVKFNCQAGICNEEEDQIDYAKINYQMLQTLIDFSDRELEKISYITKQNIINLTKDIGTMLKILGVKPSNKNKNYLQKALEIYPELLHDTYSKQILKDVKKSLIKEARAGKLDIRGKYTFIIPDLYAFCEFLFLGIKNPIGLLNNGEVFCELFKNDYKLDCLRSPHLYREHAIRINKINNETRKWFITKGLYTSCHDPISKILMFDQDGDKALVVSDPTLIEVAERNMKDIVPLQYEMAKAGAEHISNEAIYHGLIAAYTGGNIGVISNNITKIWNSDDIDLDVIKWLCMENNFVIDYAKTLYKPIRPKKINKRINKLINKKVPYFFIYAKDYEKKSVEPINNSVVNRLEKLIPNYQIRFNLKTLGKFDYKMLMKNNNVEIDYEIIDKYEKLDLKRRFLINLNEKHNNISFLYQDIKNKIVNNRDPYFVTDVIIKYLYENKKSSYKTTLWECFGDIIVENLKNNLVKYYKNQVLCMNCGKRTLVKGKNQKYCDDCKKDVRKQYKSKKEREYRKKRGHFKKTLYL
mgnify:CR=1 FL=1